MERDIKAVMAEFNTTIASIEKIKAGLEAALRKAHADMAILFAAEPQSPNRSRRTSVANGGNVIPSTNGAGAGPA